MFIFHIAAFLVLILGIGWKFRVRLVEAVPAGSAVLILGLYLLAFFRLLSLSDYVAIAGVAAGGIYVAKLSGERRRELWCFVRRELCSLSALTAVLMTLVMTVCVSGKVVSWWDDYNFWATDVKSLFYLDGFAQKYRNVAAEFGDYPPGTQLMKWWFLHFSPGQFREGLMFAGYYFLNLSFLFPLLRVLDRDPARGNAHWTWMSIARNAGLMTAGAVVFWLFPAVAEAFWLDGCCADLTMALVYGAFLVSVADREGRDPVFYYGRQALFLMVLVLCKNTGFLWVAFGLAFDYGYHFIFIREKERCFRPLLLVTVLPVLTEVSWLGFCILNRRVAKLTGTAIRMATGGMNLPAYQGEMVRAFGEAFLRWPLHRGKTPAIDLSPLGLFVLLFVFILLLWKTGILKRRQAAYVSGFLAVTGVVFYSINLVSHLTIFAVETQYLEPFGMVSSIERYGAPFAIGSLYFLAFLATRGDRAGRGALVCAAMVLLTTDHMGAFRGLWGYRNQVNEILREREEIIDDGADRFLAAVRNSEKSGGGGITGRVLYLRDISDVSWVRNTYLAFEASPVSVMYGNLDADAADAQALEEAVRESHAGFLYVDELAGETQKLFAPFTGEEEFAFGALYRVTEENGGLRLVRWEG